MPVGRLTPQVADEERPAAGAVVELIGGRELDVADVAAGRRRRFRRRARDTDAAAGGGVVAVDVGDLGLDLEPIGDAVTHGRRRDERVAGGFRDLDVAQDDGWQDGEAGDLGAGHVAADVLEGGLDDELVLGGEHAAALGENRDVGAPPRLRLGVRRDLGRHGFGSGGVVAQAAADGARELFDLPLLLAEDLALTGDHPLLFGEPALLLGEAAPVVLERLAQPLEFVGRRGVSAPPAGVRGRARTRTAGHLSAMA